MRWTFQRVVAVVALFVAFGGLVLGAPPADQAILLDIPDRAWDPNRADPSVGWCAEACIQMAMAYFGAEVTQAEVNVAGRPDHADLYVYDIDTALVALSVEYTAWDSSVEDVDVFIDWIRDAHLQGYPVLCGVKVYPDEHPDWSLDHFVLVVGYTSEGLILNTQLDLDGQVLVRHGQLTSIAPGYSFASRWSEYFGRAILGVADRD